MGKISPITKRYCNNCEKVTNFKYDRRIGHSYCVECGRGSLFASKMTSSHTLKGGVS